MPKKLLFKKVAIMHGKGEFSKTVFATFPRKLQIYVTYYIHITKAGSFMWVNYLIKMGF